MWRGTVVGEVFGASELARRERHREGDLCVCWMPVEVNEGETVYSISVLHGPKIFVRLLGDLDQETFTALLRGKGPAHLKKEPTILQCSYDDDYDDWLRGTRTH